MPSYKDLRKSKKYGKSALAYAIEKVYTNNYTVFQKWMPQDKFEQFIEKMNAYIGMNPGVELADAPRSRLGGHEKFHQVMDSQADKLGIELMEIMKEQLRKERDEKAKNNDPFLLLYDYNLHETTMEGNLMEARFESQYLSNANQFGGRPKIETMDHNELLQGLQQGKGGLIGEDKGLYEPLMEYYKAYIELEKVEFIRQKNNRDGWTAKNERAFLAELHDKQQRVVDAFDKLYAIEDNHQYDGYLDNDLGHITGKHNNRRSAYEVVNVMRWQIKAIENGWSQDELTLLGAIGYIEAYQKSNEAEFDEKMKGHHQTLEAHKDDWSNLKGNELQSYAEARTAVEKEVSNRKMLDDYAKDIEALKKQIWDKKISSPADKAQVIALIDDFTKTHSDKQLESFVTLHKLSGGLKDNTSFIDEVKNLNPKRRKYKLYDGVKYNPPKGKEVSGVNVLKDEPVKVPEEPKVEVVNKAQPVAPKEEVVNNVQAHEEPKVEVVNNVQPAGPEADVPKENEPNAQAPKNEEDEEHLEDAYGISNGYSSQTSVEDKYMYALLYKTRNRLLDRMELDNNKIEEFRDIKTFENSNQMEEEFVKNLTDKFKGEKFTFKDFQSMFDKMMLAQAKAMVLTGKDYKAIYDNLDGEHKQDKAQMIAAETGIFELPEAEGLLRSEVLDSGVFINTFKAKLNHKPGMTFEEAYDNMGFTKEEISQLRNKDNLKRRIVGKDISADKEEEFAIRIMYDDFTNVYKARGTKKALASLSAEEKMFYDLGSNAYMLAANEMNKEEQDKDKEVTRWQKEEGANKVRSLKVNLGKDQLNSINAFLYGEKTIGITRKDELSGAYTDMLGKKNDYIGAILKGDPQAEEKAGAVVNDEKLHKQLGTKNKKMGVTYSSYIKLHTGVRMGKTPEEMVENLSKCMAAAILYSNGDKFSINSIHATAKKCKEHYSLDALKGAPEMLTHMLSNKDNLVKDLNSLRDSIYNVQPDKREKYFEDMKKLADNLPTTRGHGKQYSKLNSLIRDAAAIKDKNLSKKDLDTEIRTINLKIFNASMEYFKSKGMSKLEVEKNPRAAAALNAISVMTNSTEGLKYRTTKLVVDLKKSLDARHDGAARNFESVEKFTQKYGATNTAMQKDNIKASAAKNKTAEASKKQ